MNHQCGKHSLNVMLLCLQPKCQQDRLCCLLCSDERHSRHDLVSVGHFHKMLEESLQVNRKNPDKHLILKDLNKTKAEIMNKLQTLKNKLIGLVGECEDRVEQYYAKIFHSFAVDPHHLILKDIQTHFTSEKVSSLINTMKDFENITLGSINDTQSIIYACLAVFKQKLSEIQKNCAAQLQTLKDAWKAVSFAKPKEFQYKFSKDRRHTPYLTLSDSQTTIIRSNGTGGYPMCLLQNPLNPINRSVTFKIDKTQGNKKSICLGVCLQSIVRASNFSNCGGGFNKGIYAIDQQSPYGSQENALASWNHHDTEFNQTNIGNNNIIGWTFQEGDEIKIQVDYYNSNVVFIKGNQDQWDQDDEEIKVYEMPVKLNAGPLYAFVSCQNKGDRVSIRE